ncbi:MAG: hypothetical protein ACI4OZ_09275 [Akkermansia sp.]
MIGSLIGGVAGLAGSVAGGISSMNEMRKVRRRIEEEKAENQAWYDRRYNEDATQRADARALLNRTEEAIRQRNAEAAAAQAVAGGTEEAAAAQRAANSRMMSDAVTGIAAQADSRKDALDRLYMQRKSGLNGQLNELGLGKAQAVAQAAGGAADAAKGIAGLFD